MNFSTFIGHDDAKLALVLNAIDRRCGGVLLWGEKGTGKSTLARLFKDILPEGGPFVEVPLNITEDALLGAVDIERALSEGRKAFQPGVLSRADGGVIFMDDINLLPPAVVALIAETCDRGVHVVEREGLSARHPARFIPLAAMNSEEGAFSPHFLDRFGMCVALSTLDERGPRIDILKTAGHQAEAGRDKKDLDELHRRIARGRAQIGTVSLSRKIEEYIVSRCLEAGAEGHRGEIFLLYAARAYAAYSGEAAVSEKHVDAVVPLVLSHRVRPREETEEEIETPDHSENHDCGEPPEKDRAGEAHGSAKEGNDREEADSAGDDTSGVERQKTEPSKEEVFETGKSFGVKKIAFEKDRLKRNESGRRTKTASFGKSGRYVTSGFFDNRDVAIDATLRAAAPFQKGRGRDGFLVIRPEDLRFKEREKKTGHLVVFVVDGSGSMGAQKRMVETKGSVQSLLLDCYQKRDRVALIVFRKDRAEVVLPPTSSFELAAKRLRELPVGGRTPLAAGLLEAYRLVRRTGLQRPRTRCLVVLVTDGRANRSFTQEPIDREIGRITALLKTVRRSDYIVVDVEDKRSLTKMDLAVRLAQRLDARYFRPADLKSENLTGMVREAKTVQMSND
ncbi:MAG TPA: VWA domain-containing protein [Syntrophorhabdales bacterium]|nr:VWA domain-containing protein [Syntrophorhabdales bacterium]